MTLYRDYRPQAFEDVVGQDHIVTTLTQAVEQDKLAHAYLFAGPRGTGKTSVARILAKTLFVHGVKDEILKKQILKAVEEGNLVDLTEIDAASNTGVDNIRDLIEKIQFTPLIAGAKVYIIDEAHMLSKGAFNALLKTLEEPPPYAYFILATTELHKIPATIQSRCQRFLFRQINEKDLIGRMQFIAKKEEIKADEDALMAIAHHVHGGMRDALSLLDQLRALPQITLQDVKERVGETGHEYVEQVRSALQSGDRAVIVEVVRKLEETGVPLENFVRLLLDDVRLQLHAAVSTHQPTAALEPVLDTLLQTVKDLRTAPVPGLVLEAALLSLCNTSNERPFPSVPPISAPSASTKPRAEKEPDPPPASMESSPLPGISAPASMPPLENVRKLWTAILQKVSPPSAKMSLKNGQIHAIEEDTILLSFSSAFHRDKASSSEGLHSLEAALRDAFHVPIKVRCVLESEVIGPPPIAEDSVDLASAALDVF